MSLGPCVFHKRIPVLSVLFAYSCFFSVSISTAQQVRFEWNPNPESNVAGYHLYLGHVPGQYDESIDVGFTNQYFLENGQEGATYYCSISAYDYLGDESPLSMEVSLTIPASYSSLLLYNGEEVGIGKTERAQEIDGFQQVSQENFTFQIEPTQWHTPLLRLPGRTDFRPFEVLEFYYKASLPGETHTLQLIDWGPYIGATVNIADFIEGGTITTSYKKVSIPISILGSDAFDLSSVYTFVFGTNSQSTLFYLTDINLQGSQTFSQKLPLLEEPPSKTERISVLSSDDAEDSQVLQIIPTQWHKPMVWLTGRTDFRKYETLEFNFKSNIQGQGQTLQLIDWGPFVGTPINIKDYIESQTISTDFQKVSIPLTALRSEAFDLSTVFTFVFGTNSSSAQFYISDINLKGKQILQYQQPLYDTPASYLERVTVVNDSAHIGPRALQLEPTTWHRPMVWLHKRTDFTKYDVLEFSYKANKEDQSHTLQLIDWGIKIGTTINIASYIEGGTITTSYKKVSIPLTVLQSEAFDLSSVFTLVFGTNSESTKFIIDDIKLNRLPVS